MHDTISTVINPTVPETRDKDWYTIEEVARILKCEPRHARRLIGIPPPGLAKPDQTQSNGRPRMLYHYMAHPELKGGHQAETAAAEPPTPANKTVMRELRKQDLVMARFRLQAVLEYISRRKFEDEKVAAAETCLAWRRRPREEVVEISQRLKGGNIRKIKMVVKLGKFSPRTLWGWWRIYKENETLSHDAILIALAPRYGDSGRAEEPIPPALLVKIHSLAISTARADVVKAVELARARWPGDWPNVSISTIRRRMKAMDPSGSNKTLGKKGIAAFRRDHSPDIARDYSKLPYNGLWQLDDVTEDFYGLNFDWTRMIRPKAYAVIRVPTRQWICAVTCEANITQAQVRAMIGYAMAQAGGGIPDAMQFERGAVACTDELKALLEDLGVKVHRTSMDGGKVHPGALPDQASGHFQGKGVIERNIRTHHELQWQDAGQTGPDERRTAHANLETWKSEALRRLKSGETPLAPTTEQCQERIFSAFEAHNNRPHGSLPETFFEDNGEIKKRRMSPNEYAKSLDSTIRLMDPRLIPFFTKPGIQIKVTKNGFRLGKFSYGRFDAALQEYEGKTVTVHEFENIPDYVYVQELKRMVERWDNVSYGAEGDLIDQKRAIETRKRNRFEEVKLLAASMGADAPVAVDNLRFMSNPTPERASTVCAPEALITRAEAMKQTVEQHKEAMAESERKFEIDPSDPSVSPGNKEPSLAEEMWAALQDVEALTT